MGRIGRPITKGEKFGRLTVIKQMESRIANNGSQIRRVLLVCDCGENKETNFSDLISGDVKSCGCLYKESRKTIGFKHGLSKHLLYYVHKAINERCYSSKNKSYVDYGARGIVVCAQWHGKDGFKAFFDWAINNGWREGLEINRKDNNGAYSPANCEFVTHSVNQNNTRRNFVVVKNGVRYTFVEYVDTFGNKSVSYGTAWTRIKRGWPIEKAVSELGHIK